MELKKYKPCPSCGEHNAPNKIECRRCEADLTGVKVVDSAAESLAAAPQPNPTSAPELVRICDCGEHNPPQARKCSACGEDISDIIPCSAAASEEKPFSYELRAVGEDFSVVLDTPAVVLGREAELKDYLKSKTYVSRTHARLTIAAGTVFIENISLTNRTFVNNELIDDASPTLLSNGDEIGLGGKVINGERQEQAAYFVFCERS